MSLFNIDQLGLVNDISNLVIDEVRRILPTSGNHSTVLERTKRNQLQENIKKSMKLYACSWSAPLSLQSSQQEKFVLFLVCPAINSEVCYTLYFKGDAEDVGVVEYTPVGSWKKIPIFWARQLWKEKGNRKEFRTFTVVSKLLGLGGVE